TGLLLTSAWIGALADLALPGAGQPFLHACEPLAGILRAIVESAFRVPGALLATGCGAAPALLAGAGALSLAAALAARPTLDPSPRARPLLRELALVLGAALVLAA